MKNSLKSDKILQLIYFVESKAVENVVIEVAKHF